MKNKIISIKNNDDSLWLELRADKETLSVLNQVFDLANGSDIEEIDKILYEKEKYESLVDSNYSSLFLDDKNFLAYIIFEEKRIHVILRKVLDYENYESKLVELLK